MFPTILANFQSEGPGWIALIGLLFLVGILSIIIREQNRVHREHILAIVAKFDAALNRVVDNAKDEAEKLLKAFQQGIETERCKEDRDES